MKLLREYIDKLPTDLKFNPYEFIKKNIHYLNIHNINLFKLNLILTTFIVPYMIGSIIIGFLNYLNELFLK